MATQLSLIDDMGVDNVGFLIENLGADAAELQYLRELVENSLEAIERAEREEGRIIIDHEMVQGVKKLRITDNGVGMTPDEVRQNINRLSATGGVQAFDKNFGIGAKITAAVRNPNGVVYKAWKDGKGSATILGRSDGRYGRIGFSSDDGESVDYWLQIDDDDKPEIIDESGVAVVLLGESQNEDTTLPPPEADLPTQWVQAYLERRYFRIPSNVTVQVPREIHDSARGRRIQKDTIQGQQHYLDKHSISAGQVSVPEANAEVWWWLLSDTIGEGGKTWNNRGHVAALYQDELYEVRTGRSGTAGLKDFGIYAGHPRVVIYVEPSDVLKANTSRTSLILEGSRPIDYAAIGEAFAAKMPDALAAYMAEQVSSKHGDHRKAIRESIKKVEEALRSVRYRRKDTGKEEYLEPDQGGGSSLLDNLGGSGAGRPPRPKPEDASGRVGSEYLRKARDAQERRRQGEQVDSDPTPIIKWDEDGESVAPGRAATYTPSVHVVTANEQYSGFQEMVEWAIEEVESRAKGHVEPDAIVDIATDEVKRWFEQALAEAVVALRAYAHKAKWGPMVHETGLSDEGLTSAVMSHRSLMMSAIKRGLAGQLGKTSDSAA